GCVVPELDRGARGIGGNVDALGLASHCHGTLRDFFHALIFPCFRAADARVAGSRRSALLWPCEHVPGRLRAHLSARHMFASTKRNGEPAAHLTPFEEP